jgi:hypothetical protein
VSGPGWPAPGRRQERQAGDREAVAGAKIAGGLALLVALCLLATVTVKVCWWLWRVLP